VASVTKLFLSRRSQAVRIPAHLRLPDSVKAEEVRACGHMANLYEVAENLAHRLTSIFEQDSEGRRPVFGSQQTFQNDPNWKDHLLFYEYFHGDNGAGIGASHQTGWSGLVANLIQFFVHNNQDSKLAFGNRGPVPSVRHSVH
jgi:hypothetical protein